MKAKEIEPLLAEWMELFNRTEKCYEGLRRMFGAQPESEAMELLYDYFMNYSDLLSEKIGDDEKWLDWYVWENDCGKKGLTAEAAGMAKMIPIKDLAGLAKIIEKP